MSLFINNTFCNTLLCYWHSSFNWNIRNRLALRCMSVYSQTFGMRVTLTALRSDTQRKWATGHMNWKRCECCNIFFSEKSFFFHHHENIRIFTWGGGRSGTRNNPAFMQGRARFWRWKSDGLCSRLHSWVHGPPHHSNGSNIGKRSLGLF